MHHGLENGAVKELIVVVSANREEEPVNFTDDLQDSVHLVIHGSIAKIGKDLLMGVNLVELGLHNYLLSFEVGSSP